MDWGERTSDRARRAGLVTVFSVAVVVSDVGVAALALGNLHAYVAAPKNAFTLAGDDPGYVISSLVYEAASGVRTLLLVGLAIAVVRWRYGFRRSVGSKVRTSRSVRWWVGAILVVGVEVCATWVLASHANPTATGSMLKVVACGLNVVMVGLLLRMTTAHRRQQISLLDHRGRWRQADRRPTN